MWLKRWLGLTLVGAALFASTLACTGEEFFNSHTDTDQEVHDQGHQSDPGCGVLEKS